MNKKIVSIIISLAIIPLAINSINRYLNNPLGNTTIWWIIQFLVIIFFLIGRFVYFEPKNRQHFKFVNWYLIWVFFSLFRGFFVAEIYWDYKANIGNTFILFIPLISYIATDNERLQSMLSFFVKYALPLSVVFFVSLPVGSWGWYLFPVSFLMLFFPILKPKWKIILLFITLICIFGDITARSSVIKYGVPVLFIVLLYYTRFLIQSERIINISRKVFMIIPWVLLILGVYGIFNVFKIKEYLDLSYSPETKNEEGRVVKKQDIATDSRTFIYREVLQSAIKYNYWFLGRTPARGNETVVFGDKMEEITGRQERLRNEANIPNVFTWMGVIGVILYFLIFFQASFLSIARSNNFYSKLIGLFIAFRWVYSWVEDPALFSINDWTLWLMIGACLSDSFRRMTEAQINFWVRGIFNKNYAMAFRIYEMKKI